VTSIIFNEACRISISPDSLKKLFTGKEESFLRPLPATVLPAVNKGIRSKQLARSPLAAVFGTAPILTCAGDHSLSGGNDGLTCGPRRITISSYYNARTNIAS